MGSILVTGGTGALGRVAVDRLLDAGHEVQVASRRPAPTDGPRPYAWATVDYRSGDGLDTAVTGVDAIVHCAGDLRGLVDRQLVTAARAAGRPHLVYVSIVGVDRVPLGYYRSKLSSELMISDSGLPWTVQRATQFHDLLRLALAALARLPVLPVPAGWSFQPVDVRDVADRLVEVVGGGPAGRAPDLGGPQVRTVQDLARDYLRATGRERRVQPVRIPGATAAAYRRGGHLTPAGASGRITFEEYLAGHPSPTSLSYRGRRR